MCQGLCPIPQCSAELDLGARLERNAVLFSSASAREDCLMCCVYGSRIRVREVAHLHTRTLGG